MKDALVPLPTILVAQLKTHNRTMAIISKFCPKIPRVYTKMHCVFLSLCWTVYQLYRLSHINDLRINQFY